MDHPPQEVERSGIARELGQADDARHAQDSEDTQVRVPEGDVEGEYGQEVNEGHGLEDETDAPGDGVTETRVDGAGPDAA